MSDKKTTKPTATAAKKPVATTTTAKVTKTTTQGKKPTGKKDTKVKTRTLFNALYTKKAKGFGIGFGVLPKRDLTHFTKWPRYIRIQRQRRVLMRRLKVPPTINQFTRVFDKNTAIHLFKLLDKYRPEEAKVKKARLLAYAKARAAAKEGEKVAKPEKPVSFLKHGIDIVTKLVEKKKAKLVVIAHDVDPIELVIWLPALCRRMDVPYCIVKSKSRLGQLVHLRNTSCVALTGVNGEDSKELANLVESAKQQFNNNADSRKQWGGNTLSGGVRARQAKLAKEQSKEASAKSKIN
ncbi:60S ribosomal protein L7a [Tieghemostelium lacteum]|uniref:60S ribosomal protein L7a n=1 Tax=Tieghemostelium lacteum TaxID=361077 RepID=A0A151ZRU8_TIELA|nr:60S ribosomal protein L7a [Tieghemostelium lacteum]|eukprot:KYQ96723.1 60S ribosomal protein L7a [Tieghemostelium lacteum]